MHARYEDVVLLVGHDVCNNCRMRVEGREKDVGLPLVMSLRTVGVIPPSLLRCRRGDKAPQRYRCRPKLQAKSS